MMIADEELTPPPGNIRQRRSSRQKQSSKAQGIYAHYKQKYQKMRERMQTLNLRQSIIAAESFDLPHSSTLGSSSSRLCRIRYAASAPEFNEIQQKSSSSGSNNNNKEICNNDERFENYASGEEEEELGDEYEEEEEEEEDEMMENDDEVTPVNSCFIRPTTNKNLIQELIDVDRLELLINLKGLQIRGGPPNVDETSAASLRLSRIGDEIVEQLVEWTKVLPFYNELPVEVHTHLLTQRWSELVLLSSCFYAVCTRCDRAEDVEVDQPSFEDSHTNLLLFQRRLSNVMNKKIPFEHVSKEAGLLVDKLTGLLNSFSKLNITLEAYVCLKAITLVHYGNPTSDDPKTSNLHSIYSKKVQIIQDQFVKALQIHLSQCENGPRLTDLFNFLPLLSSTAAILLNSKMFYVPFLICREPDRFDETPLESLKGIQQQAIASAIPTTTTSSPSQQFEAANSTSSSISDVELD